MIFLVYLKIIASPFLCLIDCTQFKISYKCLVTFLLLPNFFFSKNIPGCQSAPKNVPRVTRETGNRIESGNDRGSGEMRRQKERKDEEERRKKGDGRRKTKGLGKQIGTGFSNNPDIN
jgi:hypothetical protein